MKLRFQQVVLGWLLILAIGGHWPLLQSVAWVNMLVSFSQTNDFATAVEKTFDGKHPCKICTLVEEGKKAEQKQAVHVPNLKIDFFLESAEPFFVQVFSPVETCFSSPALRTVPLSPALPPPKTA